MAGVRAVWGATTGGPRTRTRKNNGNEPVNEEKNGNGGLGGGAEMDGKGVGWDGMGILAPAYSTVGGRWGGVGWEEQGGKRVGGWMGLGGWRDKR